MWLIIRNRFPNLKELKVGILKTISKHQDFEQQLSQLNLTVDTIRNQISAYREVASKVGVEPPSDVVEGLVTLNNHLVRLRKLVDNFEWDRGWSQRFGLWGLELKTQKRIRRKSVDLYAAICKDNGISSETVRTYAPNIFDRLFPG